ncbi:MAG: peptidylprolyl isomerase [Hyphomonadaceae bacterium]
MRLAIALALAALAAACSSVDEPPQAAQSGPEIPAPPPGEFTPTPSEILDASPDADWRPLDPENTLYMDFPGKGRVIIEMAAQFSPNHVANVRALSREGYFVNGAVTRVQDNFVAQWAQAADPPRPPKVGKETLPAEFKHPYDSSIEFTRLPDPDTFEDRVGFSGGFPVARDDSDIWVAHCYGTVGVGREEGDDTGGGIELYAIIGQSPRHLDKNLTVLGRVVQGMDILSSLPRGTGEIGFYETPAEYAHYTDIKLAADVPVADQTPLEVLRTDSETFAALVNARRWRKDTFYKRPAGRIGLCNITVPVRPAPK